MKRISITVVEYIRTTLQHDIGAIVKINPYLAFFLIMSGIEFMGKCLSNKKSWHSGGCSQEDFETAICSLSKLEKYKKYTSELKKIKWKDGRTHFANPPISLYKGLRCSLLHAMLPSDKILLSDGHGEPKEGNEQLVIFIDTFYDDFKWACEELVAMNWPKKDKCQNFLTISEMKQNDFTHAVSGSTKSFINYKQI